MIWSKKEVQILKESYLEKGEHYISKIIGKSPNAIRIKASRFSISKLAQRENIVLSSEEEQVILGGLLGDLYCRIKKRCKNAQIQGGHGKQQEEYLLWKLSLLNSLSFKLRRMKNGNPFFDSKVYPCLNYYHNLFYKSGKKEVTIGILNKVNELGLAIWYMDDGTYRKRDKRSLLHTNGFTYKENLMIKDWFEYRWNIYPKVYSVKKPKEYPGKVWYCLAFGVNETKKLINIIKDYIHPSMEYKIGVFN